MVASLLSKIALKYVTEEWRWDLLPNFIGWVCVSQLLPDNIMPTVVTMKTSSKVTSVFSDLNLPAVLGRLAVGGDRLHPPSDIQGFWNSLLKMRWRTK